VALEKRGSTYYVSITLPNGKRYRRSSETSDRKTAQELHDTLKATFWRQRHLNEKPTRSFEEAAERWLRENDDINTFRDATHHLAFWRKEAAGMDLGEISRDWVDQALDRLVTRRGKPSKGTKQNYMITLRSVMNTACGEWEWIPSVPAYRSYVSKRHNSKVQVATPAQAKALVSILPPGLQEAVGFAFLTGLRKSNVFGLTWDRVDIPRRMAWVMPVQTKAKNLIVCPLSTPAVAVLERLQRPHAAGLVFGVQPPCHAQWRRYVARAGLPAGFRFHDIRHTFATWLAQDGTDRKTMQDLCGWLSPAMIDNYVHLPLPHLAEASERVSARLN